MVLGHSSLSGHSILGAQPTGLGDPGGLGSGFTDMRRRW